MGKIIITEFVSLDGVAEAPEKWSLNFWNSETERFKTKELAAHAAMLLGRKTYGGFAAAWPSRSGDYADRFNALPKFAVSKTLRGAGWAGSAILSGDFQDEITALKTRTNGNIYVHGSIALAQSLLASGLADELHLLTYPVVLGSGRRLLDGAGTATLDLTSSEAFGNGVLALKYGIKTA